jgi:hypothetical protein
VSDTTFECADLKVFAMLFRRHTRERKLRLNTSVRKTALQARNLVKRTVPRAFAELANSVHVVHLGPGHSQVIVDAPHAAAVEVGSRPHTPPLEPLVRWVKLRGMQGLTRSGNVSKNRTKSGFVKDERREAARVIASALKSRERGGALGVDAPTQIARALQFKISRVGTKPYRYMFNAVGLVEKYLDGFVRKALPDRLFSRSALPSSLQSVSDSFGDGGESMAAE